MINVIDVSAYSLYEASEANARGDMPEDDSYECEVSCYNESWIMMVVTAMKRMFTRSVSSTIKLVPWKC